MSRVRTDDTIDNQQLSKLVRIVEVSQSLLHAGNVDRCGRVGGNVLFVGFGNRQTGNTDISISRAR